MQADSSEGSTAESGTGKVVYCSTEPEYYRALENAGQKLVVIDVFAEW